jgi:DNA-binding NarL/FixJ family response regulator
MEKVISNIGDKPDVPAVMLSKWQRIVNLMGDVMDAPAALITRASPQQIEVFVRNDNSENPYQDNELSPRHCGLYCDEVIQSRQPLVVTNAYETTQWNKNPDLEHELSFYLGYPLSWPDNSLFGTICILDRRLNHEAMRYRDLIEAFQQLICDDLDFLYQLENQQDARTSLSLTLLDKEREIRKRNTELAEISTAMRVLLDHREKDQESLRKDVRGELLLLIKPYLEQLEQSDLSQHQQRTVTNLWQQLSVNVDWKDQLKLSQLTFSEREIARFIQQNQSSKIIAHHLHVEKSTIDFHRRNIRKKLNLTHSDISLKQYLQSLTLAV